MITFEWNGLKIYAEDEKNSDDYGCFLCDRKS